MDEPVQIRMTVRVMATFLKEIMVVCGPDEAACLSSTVNKKKTRLHDTMIFWKQIVRTQLHKRLNARELAPRARFELATLRLTAECSTIELPGNRATHLFSF
jgi:hypothetical protein